jgi:hypothetical protein
MQKRVITFKNGTLVNDMEVGGYSDET